MAFLRLVSPTEQFLNLLMTMRLVSLLVPAGPRLSRRNEFQADSFAAKMGRSEALQPPG